MASYRSNGFAFNRDNLRGVDADTLGGITRYLVAREREINTIETLTVICEGGPFDGQQIELQPTTGNSTAASAHFSVRGWCGRYVGAVWESDENQPDTKVLDFVPVAKPTARIDAKGMGKGYDALRDLLAQLGEDPEQDTQTKTREITRTFNFGCVDDFGEVIDKPAPVGAYAVILHDMPRHGRRANVNYSRTIERAKDEFNSHAMDDYGQLFTVPFSNQRRQIVTSYREPYACKSFKIGRMVYTIPATVAACEKLAARIIAKKKWFSDKMLQAAGPVATPATVETETRTAAQVAAGCFVADLVAGAAMVMAVDKAKNGIVSALPVAVDTPARELATTGAGGGHLPPARPQPPVANAGTPGAKSVSMNFLTTHQPDTMPTTTPPDPTPMTGAELQTLREACNLSRDELASLADVQARTIKHWESGRAGVPADVAGLVTGIDATITTAARAGLQALQRARADAGGRPPQDIVLMRYQTAQDLVRYQPMAGMPPGVHGAIVGRLRLMLATLPGFSSVPVRVVWMRPELYEPWRAACQLPGSETTRAQWAAQQVDAQALPHKPDQPPPG